MAIVPNCRKCLSVSEYCAIENGTTYHFCERCYQELLTRPECVGKVYKFIEEVESVRKSQKSMWRDISKDRPENGRLCLVINNRFGSDVFLANYHAKAECFIWNNPNINHLVPIEVTHFIEPYNPPPCS